jgi:hypothetical protein
VKQEKALQLRDSTASTMAIKFARRTSTIWSDQPGAVCDRIRVLCRVSSLAIRNVADVKRSAS